MLRIPGTSGPEILPEPIDETQAQAAGAQDLQISDFELPELTLVDDTLEIIPSSKGSNDEIGEEDDWIFLERVKVISTERDISQSEFNPQEWTIEQVVGWIAYQNEFEFRSLGKIDLQPPKYLGESYTTDFINLDPDKILKSKLIAGELVGYSGTEAVPFSYWLENDIWSAFEVRFRRDQDVLRIWKPRDPKSTQPVVVPKNMSDSEASRLYSELCTKEGRQVSPDAAIRKPEFRRARRKQLREIAKNKFGSIAPGRSTLSRRLDPPKSGPD
jgi:hypothetical protein